MDCAAWPVDVWRGRGGRLADCLASEALPMRRPSRGLARWRGGRVRIRPGIGALASAQSPIALWIHAPIALHVQSPIALYARKIVCAQSHFLLQQIALYVSSQVAACGKRKGTRT